MRPVVCINTGETFATGRAAAAAIGMDPNRIVQLCSQGGVTKSGLRFRYADAEEVVRPPRASEDVEAGRLSRIEKLKARRHPPETLARMRAAAKLRGVSAQTRAARRERQRKHLVCVETGTVFRDAAEAALAYGLKRSHVYDVLFKGRVSKTALVSFRHALPHEIGKANARE